MGWFKELLSRGKTTSEPEKISPYDLTYKLWNFIEGNCHAAPDQVLELTVTTSSGSSNHSDSDSKTFWIKSIDGKLNYVCLDSNLTCSSHDQYLTSKGLLETLTNKYIFTSYHDTVVQWTAKWPTTENVESRIIPLARKVLETAPKYTFGYCVENWYLRNIAEDDSWLTFELSVFEPPVSHQSWVIDLALHLGKLKIRTDVEPFRIYDRKNVHYELLPDTHWRRWVKITPAVDNTKAALKVVPRGVGKGKVLYYDILFDFDRDDLAGVAFSAGELILGAVSHVTGTCQKMDIVQDDTFFTPEAVMVRYKTTHSLEEWLDMQRADDTKLDRPYLSPNQPAIKFNGHQFRITSDYYIDFTPWVVTK